MQEGIPNGVLQPLSTNPTLTMGGSTQNVTFVNTSGEGDVSIANSSALMHRKPQQNPNTSTSYPQSMSYHPYTLSTSYPTSAPRPFYPLSMPYTSSILISPYDAQSPKYALCPSPLEYTHPWYMTSSAYPMCNPSSPPNPSSLPDKSSLFYLRQLQGSRIR